MRLRPLIRLIFTLIVNRLTERMDFEGGVQICNRHRLLFMIDEFPSLKQMEVFADALSYMAGYGLNAYLIAQDIRQIVKEYGPNESIVSNCHVRIAYAPNQYDTAELLSKMAGTKTVQKATYSFSGSRLAPVANHMSATVDHVERPLMTPDEVMRLRPAKKRGRGVKERIVAPGKMLIFVSGNYPIYGTQILYFKDPVLAQRAALPPPVAFFAIEEGKVIPQCRADRTPNVISAAEPRRILAAPNPVPDSPMSPMERAFWKELGEAPADDELQRQAVRRGFVEQLDLDLHESSPADELQQ
jgi:type IV secretion system protein VirD4